MRFRHTKSRPEELRDALASSVAAARGEHGETLLKAALIAGGAAALTAASAAISSFRRRTETSS
jgi:hypothetical protein